MTIVGNAPALVGHGMSDLRRAALAIAEAGLSALDPAGAVDRMVERVGDVLVVEGRTYSLNGRVVVLGAGKASLRTAAAVERLLDDHVSDGIVVVRRGEGGDLARLRVVEADHPIPTEASLRAARSIIELADRAQRGDLVVCCITGGSSALLSLPPPSVDFAAKRKLHELLLSSGASIFEINAVRKHVSSVKGGRLAGHISPAAILNLTVSDVAGDALDYITDPTVQDTSTPGDAIDVLHRYGLWDQVAPEIRSHIGSRHAESPDILPMDINSVTLVRGTAATAAMADTSRALGFTPVVLDATMAGDAVESGRRLAALARRCLAGEGPAIPPCVLLACGGEYTVRLDSWLESTGAGGPNQELVLSAARGIDLDHPIVVLSVDTDGSDGGTRFAGGIADGETQHRVSSRDRVLETELARHRSSMLLEQLADVVITGATGTNVNDLTVVAVGASC